MAGRKSDFHDKPFDDGTKAKLELYRAYIREWLPVFVGGRKTVDTISIVDFFAGPGRDGDGVEGSPLIAIRELRKSTEWIRESGVRVQLLFNEVDPDKAATLRKELAEQKIPDDLCKWTVQAEPFEVAFDNWHPMLRGSANFLFVDQFGLSQVTEPIFRRMVELPVTDFMFFLASSFVRRFAEHPSIQTYIDIPKDEISSGRFPEVHRKLLDYYKDLVPPALTYFLGPFSIKKGSNIYGIIFGSGHPLGMEKFLSVCWKMDKVTGEANFDIDDEDINPDEPRLFPDMDRPKKLDVFERRLTTRILDRDIVTDGDIYIAALQEGVLPSHAKAVLRSLIKNGIVRMSTKEQPRVSLKGYSQPRTIEVIEDGTK